jgi:hypothetical protein
MSVATCAGVRRYVDSLLSFSSAIYLEWTSERAGKVLALGERIGEMRIVERMLMTGMDSWAGLFVLLHALISLNYGLVRWERNSIPLILLQFLLSFIYVTMSLA